MLTFDPAYDPKGAPHLLTAHHHRRARLAHLAAAVALLTLLGTGCADLAPGMDQPAPQGDPAADAPAVPAPAVGDEPTPAPQAGNPKPAPDTPVPRVPEKPAPAAPGAPIPATPPAAPGTPVQVALSEWKVTPDMPSVAAGKISFTADNIGLAPHELVVVRAESLAALPLDADGAVDETKLDDGAVIGEIERITTKTSKVAAFDLEPGRYTLICNLKHIDGNIVESHYAFGMGTEFEVTAP